MVTKITGVLLIFLAIIGFWKSGVVADLLIKTDQYKLSGASIMVIPFLFYWICLTAIIVFGVALIAS
jgi:hypothetical protein